MSFQDLDIKISYISCGDDSIAKAFLVPALKQTKLYQRSVGFFSSGVFEPIMDGIVALYRNKGRIELIASPKLSEEDIEAINAGYQKRESIYNSAFTRDFVDVIDKFDDVKLNLLATLIAEGTLDIKIAVTDTSGDYHDKLGILEDFDGNTIVFYGSANSSINGYRNNYEKIRVVKSWIQADNESIVDEKNEFHSLWTGTNPFVNVYEYTESAKANILQIMDRRKQNAKVTNSPIQLRDYQQQAIQAWVDNDYHGFYVMATGTGKTWTAIYSAKRLLESKSAMIVICAPYKHLVRQWTEDIVKVFPEAKLIMVSSENPNWEQQISQEIIRKKYNSKSQIIIVSTIASFKMERFTTTLLKSNEEKLLIVDEAHRLTDRPDSLKKTFKYMLGLSATPYSGSSAQKGKELMNFFGGQVFSLPIEEALDRGFLVPYNYYPIFVNATSEEEEKFKYYTLKIISCFNKNGKIVNQDLLVTSTRNRLRLIAMAKEKQDRIEYILSQVAEKDHFIIYCGDGKLFDPKTGEDIRHIQSIKRVLSSHDYKASQFTAQENMEERMSLVDAFNKGEIDSLVAIRCLDEGINIPSIQSALILASNDDYREFVQRRGRILRTYKDKKVANIYDVIVMPSPDVPAWAKIELRRFREYAHLALNWNTLESELETQKAIYGLTDDDINVFDYDEMEDESDE